MVLPLMASCPEYNNFPRTTCCVASQIIPMGRDKIIASRIPEQNWLRNEAGSSDLIYDNA